MRTKKKNVFNSILINARSILLKLLSLEKTLDELAADICIITETWLKNDHLDNQTLIDFQARSRYQLIRRDRTRGRGGGVGIVFNTDEIQLSRAKIPPNKHEILAAIGRRAGQRRKIVIIAVYIPPGYTADRTRSLCTSVNDTIQAMKKKYTNPYILIGGDFNRRDARATTSDHRDLRIIDTGPTRLNAVLDIQMSNMNELLIDQGTAPPIVSDQGIATDHLTVFASFRMARVPAYEIQNYTYHHINKEGDIAFGEWLRSQSWTTITEEEDASAQVDALHQLLQAGMDHAYEVKTRKKKSSEPPWMAEWLRDMIEDRRCLYRNETRKFQLAFIEEKN